MDSFASWDRFNRLRDSSYETYEEKLNATWIKF